jgi:hypothetical protein
MKSLTWDRGLEMARHKDFSIATHVDGKNARALLGVRRKSFWDQKGCFSWKGFAGRPFKLRYRIWEIRSVKLQI